MKNINKTLLEIIKDSKDKFYEYSISYELIESFLIKK